MPHVFCPSAERTGVLRCSVISVVLVVAGISLWLWDEKRDNPLVPTTQLTSQAK
jgi:hypothetical protein